MATFVWTCLQLIFDNNGICQYLPIVAEPPAGGQESEEGSEDEEEEETDEESEEEDDDDEMEHSGTESDKAVSIPPDIIATTAATVPTITGEADVSPSTPPTTSEDHVTREDTPTNAVDTPTNAVDTSTNAVDTPSVATNEPTESTEPSKCHNDST